MTSKDLKSFYEFLEDLATYYELDSDEEYFLKNIKLLKNTFQNANLDIPKEIQMSKKSSDFRFEMQKIGGYKERRDRLKSIIYPIIDYLEDNEENIIQKDNISQSELNNYIKNNNYSIETTYGTINNISLNSKSGGNGIVYFGYLNKTEIAIKFLLNSNSKKKKRFLCEFINVIMSVDNYEGIVKQYFYEEIKINNYKIPAIVMKKYNNNLEYKENISQNELVSSFSQITHSIQKLHNKGIIHRDLKPQNILLDENNKLNIADFGIAFYNKDLYDLTGNTEKNERLANFEFSAPELKNSENEPTKASDIYSIGQIIYWMIYGYTNKGTHAKKITEKYPGDRMIILENIIDKCLCNEPKDRYQSIEEIYTDIEKYNKSKKIANTKNSDSNTLDINEIKEQLIDIIDNIIFIKNNNLFVEEITKTFTTVNDFNKNKIINFIEQIPEKENNLLFYDEVYFSDYYDGFFINQQKIKKIYFKKLYELYIQIKDNSEIFNSFITYIVKTFNDNCVELPF